MSETSYPRIVLVDAPSFDANVRFDLNSVFGAATCVTNADGFSLGAPTLQGDPGSVGGTYGERQITLTPRIEGPKAAALSVLSALARELLRAENWLLVQLDALTEPVWFHLYRSTPGVLSLDEVDVEELLPDAWQTTLSLTSDAFNVGGWITLPPMTFTQSPTGLFAALPAIKGDAPTGLRISVDPAQASGYGSRWLLASISGPADVNPALFDIGTGDIFTPGFGAAAGSADNQFFGGSVRMISVDTAAGAVRLAADLAPVATARYRLLLRCGLVAHSSHDTTYYFRRASKLAGFDGPTTSVVVPQGSSGGIRRAWVDLGDASASGVQVPTSAAATSAGVRNYLFAWVDSAAGTGTVIADALLLLPTSGADATASALSIYQPTSGLVAGGVDYYDGEEEISWGVDGGGIVQPSTDQLSGGFPTVDPAADSNRLVVIAKDDGGGLTGASITSLNASASVTVSYQPKYLHLPGDPDA